MQVANIIIGFRRDAQTQACQGLFDQVLYWEDFPSRWSMIADPRGLYIVTSGEKWLLSDVHVYVRGSHHLATAKDDAVIANLSMMLMQAQPLYPAPGKSPLNKLGQLAFFSDLAPSTKIVKSKLLTSLPTYSIVKSISQTRSRTVTAGELSANFSDALTLSTPTLFQERIFGVEHKVNAFIYDDVQQYLNVQINTVSLDYRYDDVKVGYKFSRNVPQAIADLCQKIFHNTHAKFFDVDYFVDHKGRIKVLEWNNAPASASLEVSVEGKLSFSQNLVAVRKPVILASRADNASKILSQLKPGEAVFLAFEDYGRTWHFYMLGKDLCFQYQGKRIWSRSIYLRPTRLRSNVPREPELQQLMHMLDARKEKVFSPLRCAFWNGSKALQLTTSLRKAKLAATKTPIQLPKSFILKGSKGLLTDLLERKKDLIVKSNSGVRSRVVDQDTFCDFDLDSIGNAPVFLQEKIVGDDVRVHYLADRSFGKVITGKSEVDYRYATERSEFMDIDVDEGVHNFCSSVSIAENNPLIGVDFLLSENGYACLEANPSPGWNWYYPALSSNDFSPHLRDVIYDA